MRALRLTGGLDRCSGKLEIHRNGSWGTVCDNCWNENMAAMVCSMLQCGTQPKNYTRFSPPLLHNVGPQWFFWCNFNVQSLWDCKEFINQIHLCADSKASGVICNGEGQFVAATSCWSVSLQKFPTLWQTQICLRRWKFGMEINFVCIGVCLCLAKGGVAIGVACCKKAHNF